MAVRQIEHRKSRLVLSARVPVVKWRSCSVAKSAIIETKTGLSFQVNPLSPKSDQHQLSPNNKNT